jgi:hypothetical protein
MEGFVLVFAVAIPPIKYLCLYFLYSLHGFASLVPACRKKFLENGDFEDPYLCSIYFGRTAWRDFWSFCHGEKQSSTIIAFAKAFFSKTTASVYLIIASSVFLIAQASTVSAGQAFGFIFVVFVLVIPVCCTISFPFFLISAFRWNPPTDNQVCREFAVIAKSESPRDVFFRYVTFSRRYQKLRSISIVFTGFMIAIVIVTFIVGSGPEGATEMMLSAGARTLEDSRHRVTHAMCDATVKNLSMIQIGYLEQLSETMPDTEAFNLTLDVLPAVFGWENLSYFSFIDAPFPDDLGAYLRHMYLHDRHLHVFAICGTKSFVDILVDIELWATAALISIFRPFVPFLVAFTHVGRSFQSALLALPRGIFRRLSLGELYIDNIRHYIESVPIGEDEDVLLTGHSLGGGIAKALALTTKLATVAWSGPGTRGLEGVLGGTETRPNMVSVSPERDWVAPVDPSDGTIFRLPCKSGSMGCHDLRRMLCQMAAMCGSFEATRERCEGWFQPAAIQEILDLAKPTYTYRDVA